MGLFVLYGVLGLAVAAQPEKPGAELPPELATAARDYRIEIYGAFRQDRQEYDSRRKQAEELLAEWQTRGSLRDELTVLVRWFGEARRAAARQQPSPDLPNWNRTELELIPLPPRRPSFSQSVTPPTLRAEPQPRVRIARVVQLTALSAELLRPRESQETFSNVSAPSEIEALHAVLALVEFPRLEARAAMSLQKQEPETQIKISSNSLVLPAAKLNPNSSTRTTSSPTTDEPAELNTAELSARLRGYDKAWRALQVDLYSEEALTLDRAEGLVAIFADLSQARRDLLLYQAIAPAELRAELRAIAALDELQKQLRVVLEKARAITAADPALSPVERAVLDRAWGNLLEQIKN